MITGKNIPEIATFLKESVEWLKKEQCGCCHYNLDDDLALYVGWESGYDRADDSIISDEDSEDIAPKTSGWSECYAICAGVKIRNDSDCADYEFLDFPWYQDGECCILDCTISPHMDYQTTAQYFVNEYQVLRHLIDDGFVVLKYPC